MKHMMTGDFARLYNLWLAKKHAPRYTGRGRKSTKKKAAGVGQILSNSRVIPQVSMSNPPNGKK